MGLLSVTILLYFGTFFIVKCSATIDLSNVNLHDFKYFKNKLPLPNSDDNGNGHHIQSDHLSSLSSKLSSVHQLKGTLAQAVLEPITQKFQKAKAVAVYFKNVLLGNPEHEHAEIIEFNPHFGEAWKPYYEHYYGPKGQYLVESLGKGFYPLHSNKLHYYDDYYHHYNDHHYNDHHFDHDDHDHHHDDLVSHHVYDDYLHH